MSVVAILDRTCVRSDFIQLSAVVMIMNFLSVRIAYICSSSGFIPAVTDCIPRDIYNTAGAPHGVIFHLHPAVPVLHTCHASHSIVLHLHLSSVTVDDAIHTAERVIGIVCAHRLRRLAENHLSVLVIGISFRIAGRIQYLCELSAGIALKGCASCILSLSLQNHREPVHLIVFILCHVTDCVFRQQKLTGRGIYVSVCIPQSVDMLCHASCRIIMIGSLPSYGILHRSLPSQAVIGVGNSVPGPRLYTNKVARLVIGISPGSTVRHADTFQLSVCVVAILAKRHTGPCNLHKAVHLVIGIICDRPCCVRALYASSELIIRVAELSSVRSYQPCDMSHSIALYTADTSVLFAYPYNAAAGIVFQALCKLTCCLTNQPALCIVGIDCLQSQLIYSGNSTVVTVIGMCNLSTVR